MLAFLTFRGFFGVFMVYFFFFGGGFKRFLLEGVLSGMATVRGPEEDEGFFVLPALLLGFGV